MKPRMEPLAASPGSFVVESDRGPHRFRLPPWSQAERLVDFLTNRGAGRAGAVEWGVAAVGLAWRHELLELQTAAPAEMTADALLAYSTELQIELEDAGYTVVDVMVLGNAVVAAINARTAKALEVRGKAKVLGDFSEPPQARPSS